MNLLDRLCDLIEKWEQGQDELYDQRERERKEYEERFGHPPYGGFCATPDIEARFRRMRRKDCERFRKMKRERLQEAKINPE